MRFAAPAAFAAALRAVGRRWAQDGRPEPEWLFGPAFGPHPSVTARLEAGEALDLVILPEAALQAQARAGRIVPGTIRTAFRAGIAMAVPAGSHLNGIASAAALRASLLGARRIACTRASSGVHLCERVLPALGIEPQGRLLRLDSGDVAAELAAGRADIGFQLMCELVGRPGIVVVGPLPADLQHHVVAGVGIAVTAPSVDEASALVALLCSRESEPLLGAAGLEAVA